MGYLDFAGSGVVHMLGGSCALAGAMACGPRVGRFSTGESEQSHSRSVNDLLTPAKHPVRYKIVDKLCCRSKFMYKVVDIITLNIDPGFHIRDQPGHSAPMQCLGALLLYVAWFSFNAGSSGGMDTLPKANSAARAAVNTMLAAASGTVGGLLWCDLVRGQYEIDLVVNGLLSGMVAITAPCGYCDPWAAIVLGALSVPVYVYSSKFVIYVLHVE
jgi:Amt family ammonium transporter